MRYARILSLLSAATIGLSGCSSSGSDPSPQAASSVEGEKRAEVTDRAEQAEFRSLVSRLARAGESENTQEFLDRYSRDAYLYNESVPRTNIGPEEYQTDVTAAFRALTSGRVTLHDDGFQMWKRDGRVWTLQPFTFSAELGGGRTLTYQGRQSALWEKQSGRWVIVYERVLGPPPATQLVEMRDVTPAASRVSENPRKETVGTVAEPSSRVPTEIERTRIARTELPRTASRQPLVAVLGLLSLCGALTLRLTSRT